MRLVRPDEILLPDRLEYRLCPLQRGTKSDPKKLLEERYARRATRTAADSANWYDIQPGSYLVGAILGNNWVLASSVVEYSEDQREFELRVPDLTEGPPRRSA